MATVQKRPSPARPADRDPQVYHPLDRLRGVIRRYVVVEGVLSAVLFVAAWFALGLLFDFGLFKTVGWDWVRDSSWWLRLLALVVALALFAGILVFRIARRLATEFSYPSLALVLERKFPKLLGDRLITAVEMADVERMGRFGYSTDMIRATIAEARERVGKVPVNEVFNWRRLWLMGLLAVAILAGTLAAAFASHVVATRAVDPYRFGWRFAHVTGIFLERNVALQNTPWPRRAHVELVGFPVSGELTVARDAPAPHVTARAYRWVVADRAVPEGWRPMLWSDVTEAFVGRRVPPVPFELLRVKGDNSPVPGDAGDWTVDTVEALAFEAEGETPPPEVVALRAELKKAMNGRHDGNAVVRTEAGEPIPDESRRDYEELQEVFKALQAKADEPSMGRTIRRLDLPAEVTYKYAGRRTAGSGTLVKDKHLFAGEIAGLKEDVAFVVRADDFTTSPYRIRLIPPPTLKRLYRVQDEPAYLHHAAPQGESEGWLRGKLQRMAEKNVSLTGNRSVFVVPSGTELVLHAEADEPEADRIRSVTVKPVKTERDQKFPGAILGPDGKPTQTPVPLPVEGDGAGFSLAFRGEHRLVGNVEFEFTFTNKFDVPATRSILIQVVEDQPPAVEVATDVIRKSGNVYLVTPVARIPFNTDSFVKDDHGLSKLEYTFTYQGEDSDVVRGLRMSYALRSLLGTPAPGPMMVPGSLVPLRHFDNFRLLDKGDDRLTAAVGVSEYSNQASRLRRDTPEALAEKLKSPLAEDSVPERVGRVDLKNPDRDYFDLRELNQLGVVKILAPPGDVQPIYRMDLSVQATDNNVDNPGGPRVARNPDPIRLKIISEGDLLIEISREEEQLAGRLDEALTKLAAAKKKYEFVRSTNGYKEPAPENVDAVKVRSQDAIQDVEKARDVVQSVVREFRRIHRECQVNRVNDVATHNYGKLANLLDRILGENPAPVNEAEADAVRRGDSAAVHKTSFPETLAYLTAVQNLLNTGQWAPLVAVSDAEIKLYTLESELTKIRKAFGEAQNKDKLKKALRAIMEQQERISAEFREMKRRHDEVASADTPALGDAGAQFLAKGETKKVRHTIQWRQYPKDDIVVKVTASDPSVVVPGEMKLNYERNELFFEYEVRAGNKEGMFKVTLTPEVGKPVEVQVTVK